MDSAALFVSDLHLHPTRPGITDRFLRFLTGPAAELGARAGAVYILGDLFDAWAGDDDLDDPFNAGICAALRRCADTGARLFLIPGNRDFLVGDTFAAASGVAILDEPMAVDVAGTPTLLLHGDLLCTDDTGYQEFRATVRSPRWREEFLAMPLARRKALIEGLRARSEAEKQTKPAVLMDVNTSAVADAFRRHGVARMIHGHTHRQAEHRETVDGRECTRWVLGDWHEDRGNALLCDAAGCRFLSLP